MRQPLVVDRPRAAITQVLEGARCSARVYLLKAGFIVVAVVGSASVLWLRQADDALLRADSFAAAIAGVLLLLIWGWWRSATDWHSTAALGPGLLGWLLVPVVVLCGFAIEAAARARRKRGDYSSLDR